jgi:hypothetical protein
MVRVLILGYYHRNNFGDDLFEYVFKNHVLSNYDVTFANIDDLQDMFKIHARNRFTRVIFGGGDIINTYYFSEKAILDIRKHFRGVQISFYGVGMSYPQLLPILDIGDLFLMRNKIDYESVKWRYGSHVTSYTPDLGYFLLDSCEPEDTSTVKHVGVCLPYPMFKDRNSNLLSELAATIRDLSRTCRVSIVPFDTSSNKDNSDLLLQELLRPLLAEHEFDENGEQSIFYVTRRMDVSSMLDFFKSLDFVIAGRFHSIILAMLTGTPFIAPLASKKIENMAAEVPAEIQKLFCTPEQLPKFKLEEVVATFADARVAMRSYKVSMQRALHTAHNRFIDSFQNAKMRSSPPQYISNSERTSLVERTIKSVINNVCKKPSIKIEARVTRGEPINKIVLKRRKNDHSLQKSVTEEILWQITGDPYGVYYYGLYDNAHCKQLVPQLEWIIDDYYTRYMFRNGADDNIQIINKNFQELHRSGWQFIVNNMVIELNRRKVVDKPLIIDTYVDKTFHWNSNFYKSKDIIPYRVDWIGFVHHTFSSYNNSYNCSVLFRDPFFLESLKSCRCLVVMSNYLKCQIEEIIGRDRVRIEVVYHPTEETGTMFTWERFLESNTKQVVQIGNWLRNVFAIYSLELPKSSIIQMKSVLRNRNTDNYFLPENGLDEMISNMSGLKNDNTDGTFDMCKITFDNMHVKGMLEHIKGLEDSVSVLNYLDNGAYDQLLSRNIVFINLIDASAVNTIIECIMRNTPILVNPIDAALEFLGPEYPLFYGSMYEASKILENTELIRQGYLYLVNMDKSPFVISTFITQMNRILEFI